MKKITAIFLLFIYLVGSTDAYQLLKLPKLAQHYRLHRRVNAQLSLADFLLIHYNNGPLVVDNDFEQDMELPFKTNPQEFSNTVNMIVPAAPVLTLIIQQQAVNDFIIRNEPILSLYKCSPVFQPPRC